MTGKETMMITGVGGDIGQNIARCIRESGYDFNLLGCDIDPYAAGQEYTDSFIVSPRASDESEYLNFLKKAVEEHELRYIFPSTEAEIGFLDQHRDWFSQKNVILFINNPLIINTFLDKHKSIKFFKENNIPCPETYSLDEYQGQLSYPVIIKSLKSWGGKGLFIVNDDDELEFYRSRLEDAIVQESIGSEDEEYTVGVFSDGNRIFSIAFWRQLGYGSMTRVARKVQDDSIHQLVEHIARACNLKGSINVQMRKTENGYVPFEINPRISSTVYFRHYFGFQDVKWWLDMVNDKKISYTEKYQTGIGVRNVGEVFFDLEE